MVGTIVRLCSVSTQDAETGPVSERLPGGDLEMVTVVKNLRSTSDISLGALTAADSGGH